MKVCLLIKSLTSLSLLSFYFFHSLSHSLSLSLFLSPIPEHEIPFLDCFAPSLTWSRRLSKEEQTNSSEIETCGNVLLT